MRRFWGWTSVATALLLGAMGATLGTTLGAVLWHYNGAFALTLAAAGFAWPLLQRRRVATLAMAFTGAAAVVTGFVMLYSRQLPSKEWVTWWHSATSFALLLAFVVHWLHNHPRLWDLTTRLFTRARVGYLASAAWIGVLVVGAWTWTPAARGLFTSEGYLPLASWTVLAGVVFAYGLWLVHRLPGRRERLADTPTRNRMRGLVDTSLFLANWGAMLTGFALLYFAGPLRDGPLKYVSKWWHTATSVAFLALVALHVGFNARPLAAHARRVDGELRR